MLMDILLTVPILLLFLMTALRCLGYWGLALPEVWLARQTRDRYEADESYSPARTDILKVFVFALAFRAFMLLVMFICSMLSGGDNDLSGFPGQFTRWDARHYINLIEKGYAGYQEDGRHLFLVFYPLYVWASRLLRLVIPNTVAAGLTVSVLSYAWGCCFVYRIAAKRLGRQTARDSLVLMSLYPFSFFFGTVMTEGLFLLTTSAACYFALERRWICYGVWGALAALTRMTGVLVIIPAAVELLSMLRALEKPVLGSLRKAAPGFFKRLPAILMPLLGAMGYLMLNWHVDCDPFAFAGHQAHWYQGGKWISGVLQYLWGYFIENVGNANGYAIWLPELVLFAAVFTVILLAARRQHTQPGLLAYALCYFVANYSLSWLLSAGRYLSCCFPLFIFGAALIDGRPNLRQGIYAAEAVLLGVYLYAYIAGAQVM